MAALGRGARLPLLSPLAPSLHRAPLAPFFVFPKAALATSALRCLRKPAARKGTFLVGGWVWWCRWPVATCSNAAPRGWSGGTS